MNLFDFRSDTVTMPTEAMKKFMFEASLGDDVFGEDPTILSLESKMATMFGMEAALFCPSGTMTNQIAIKVHTRPGDEIICARQAHIYNYEGGGIAMLSGASARLIERESGILTESDIISNINMDDPHYPKTSLVCLENTSNRGGGCTYKIADIKEIKKVCKQHGLNLHLDGARLFNALIANNEIAKEYGSTFDSISICLSKGLGAPVGSVLLGNKNFIYNARRVRKVFGGGMRQAGIIAAAGIFALDNHIERLAEDHLNAALIASASQKCKHVERVLPVETNIIILVLKSGITAADFLKKLVDRGIRAVAMGPDRVRFVTHLDVTKIAVEKLVELLPAL